MIQPKLTAIIRSRRLTLVGDIACLDDNADAFEDSVSVLEDNQVVPHIT